MLTALFNFRYFPIFSFVILLVFSSHIFAGQENQKNRYLPSADLINIAQHPTWLKLLHYKSKSNGQFESEILSDEFFIHSDGRHAPLAELEATIKAFSLRVLPDMNVNAHAQCQFKARYLWLKKHLSFDDTDITPVDCPDYNKWAHDGSAESISIVFATGYLGNPASYYGHILLKVNASDKKNSTNLEDNSVNFGAIVPKGEGALPYILKGLLGGYSAGFSQIQFYFHNHNYGETELRDLWEYELNYSREDAQFVIAHAWELIKKEYQYFFLDENCAKRLAEILEIVEGVNVVPTNPVWSMPQALIKNINRENYNNAPLVKNITYHPSRQSRLYKRYFSLNRTERDLVEAIVDDINVLNASEFNTLELSKKHLVLDVLTDYYQYIRVAEDLENDNNNIAYRKVVSKRFSTPPGITDIDFSYKTSPHLSRNPSQFAIGFFDNENVGPGLDISIRPAYYDALDSDAGHIPLSALTMGKLSGRYYADNDKFRINTLEVFSVESVTSASTGLPGDRNNAWKIGLGAKPADLSCFNCLRANFDAHIGKTFYMGSRVWTGGFMGAAVHSNRLGTGHATGYLSLDAFANIAETLRARIHLTGRRSLDGSYKEKFKGSLEVRYRFTTNNDLRFKFSRDVSKEFSLSTSIYW